MGSGKTSWSIQHINSGDFENVLYITPFLDEVKRILDNTNRNFLEPINRGSGKLSSINELLSCQADIASTHELFKHLDEYSRDAISEGHYTLILDEVLNVVIPYDDIKADDMRLLKESGCVTIDDEGYVIWNKDKLDYDTKYNEIKILSDNKSLMYVNGKLLLWVYSPRIFSLFDNVYIMTYLFESSILKNYFDLYQIEYELKSIKRGDSGYKIVDYYIPDTSKYKELINVYDGNLNNNITQKRSSLSKTWFSSSINRETVKQLKNNVQNYFKHICKAKSETILWSTFKDCRSKLKGQGYSSQFLSFNCRSTNSYADRYNLAYCLNIYLHPGITQFFKQHGVYIDEDMYALSEMLQWIWRSRIRTGDAINIYVPSNRMRGLLLDWLNMSLYDKLEKAS